jgi:N6-adenosine-specific RNA methylase IME4
MGMGWYTSANAEVCLLAKKGKPKVLDHSVKQVIESVREKHSKKPDEVRDRIVRLCGDLPRIELFAREKADGWDSWGDGV